MSCQHEFIPGSQCLLGVCIKCGREVPRPILKPNTPHTCHFAGYQNCKDICIYCNVIKEHHYYDEDECEICGAKRN